MAQTFHTFFEVIKEIQHLGVGVGTEVRWQIKQENGLVKIETRKKRQNLKPSQTK